MVNNKFKVLISIAVLALVLCVPVLVSVSAANEIQDVSVAPVATSVDYDKIGRVLSANRVFDDMLSDDLTVIEEATISLLDKAEGEFIESVIIEDFCKNLYGRSVDLSVAVYEGMPANDGYIAIVPRCYNSLNHFNIRAAGLSDGTVMVESTMRITMFEDEYHDVQVCTMLLPNDESSFGYTILSANIAE